MGRPTVTSILPRTGHTGGDTLVEIRGAGFALPPPPPARGKAPEQPQRVRVLFGGVEAERVEVAGEDLVYCWTPEHDPIEVRALVTGNPTSGELDAPGHAFRVGMRVAMRVRPDGSGAAPVGAPPSPFATRTAYYVVGVSAGALQLAASRGGAPIDATGPGSGDIELVGYAPCDVVVENLAPRPAKIGTAAGPFNIAPGDVLNLLVGDDAEQVTFEVADIASSGAATAAEVAAVLSRARGLRVSVVGGAVRLETDARGPGASLTLAGGSAPAIASLGLAEIVGEEQTGGDELEPIEEEGIAVPGSFTFVRPDLGIESHVATTIRMLIRALKREVIGNVHMSTHTDYDADTGDLVSSTFLAELPSLVLANLRLPENRDDAGDDPEEREGTTPETFTVREPEHLVDIRFTLVGVSDDSVELLNLSTAVQRFFRKHHELVVPRPGECAGAYDMSFVPGAEMSISFNGDASNTQSFAGEVVIKSVPVGDMAIADQGDLPEGVPLGTRYEGVRDLGWTQEGETTLEVEQRD